MNNHRKAMRAGLVGLAIGAATQAAIILPYGFTGVRFGMVFWAGVFFSILGYVSTRIILYISNKVSSK